MHTPSVQLMIGDSMDFRQWLVLIQAPDSFVRTAYEKKWVDFHTFWEADYSPGMMLWVLSKCDFLDYPCHGWDPTLDLMYIMEKLSVYIYGHPFKMGYGGSATTIAASIADWLQMPNVKLASATICCQIIRRVLPLWLIRHYTRAEL